MIPVSDIFKMEKTHFQINIVKNTILKLTSLQSV
jgi:hypothetical protein